MKKLKSDKLSDLANHLPDKVELTLDRSHDMALYISLINEWVASLDGPYLKEVLQQMKEGHSFKESASVLAMAGGISNFDELQAVEALKIKRLELIIELYDNNQQLREAQANVGKVLDSQKEIARIFGLK